MGIFKKSKNSWLCQVTAPEAKIFLIFCYLLVYSAIMWSDFTYAISKKNEFESKIMAYFKCSINGIHNEDNCEQERKEIEDISLSWLFALHLVLAAFLNLSNLPLVIEYKKIKKIVLSALGRHTVKDTSSRMGKQGTQLSHTT